MERVTVLVRALIVVSLAILLMLFATACGGESGAQTARNRPPGGAPVFVAYVLSDDPLVAHNAVPGARLWHFTPSQPSATPW